MPDELAGLRRRIDACDEQIVHWINERLKICQEIGQRKEGQGMQIRFPEREREVIEKVLGRSEGPCPPEVLEKMYRLLIDTAVALEEAKAPERPEG